MPLVLHKIDGSPPVRAVLMTLEILGLKAEMVEVNTLAEETKKPEFIAKNPMHTVPLLEDGDFIIADSHAIITYLVSKYGADQRQDLYSSDFNLRATIDQRMYFDASKLFPAVISMIKWTFTNKGSFTQEQLEAVEDGYEILERYLERLAFVAHNRLTLADISIVSTVSTLDIFVPISAEKYPNVIAWFEKIKETEFYQKGNIPGLEQLKGFVKTFMEKNAENKAA